MFEVPQLDAHSALDAAVECRRVADRAEAELLSIAAHWADLHGGDSHRSDGRVLPGLERAVRPGGDPGHQADDEQDEPRGAGQPTIPPGHHHGVFRAR